MRQQASLIAIVALGIACTTANERSDASSVDSDAAFLAASSGAAAASAGAPELPIESVREQKASRADDATGRDPFQPAPLVVVTPPPPRDDGTPRKAKRYALEQLKLVGIVGGEEQPRAMLVDPNGKGWIVTRGEYVGRVENLSGWRVDRVRGDGVVFTRADPLRPQQAPETRVIALHAPPASDSAELDD
ncbi:MAG: hypothetical protein JST00_31960 [Deltaproteobacteria bacterium]|nr:hypothetical protein [Deltaproteobacteria bacterium]